MNDKKILVVEDEHSLATALQETLEDEGFEVAVASDGQSGLTTALSEHPDLILLDIVMPKKNGLEMLKDLRKDSWGKNVPVIMLTNVETNDQLIEKIMDLGVQYHLSKVTTSLKDIIGKVRQVFEE